MPKLWNATSPYLHALLTPELCLRTCCVQITVPATRCLCLAFLHFRLYVALKYLNKDQYQRHGQKQQTFLT